MPPRRFMRAHGSGDEEDVKITGNEFMDIFKYSKNRAGLIFATIFAVAAGCGPLWMQRIMGGAFQTLGTTEFGHKDLVKVVLSVMGGQIALQAVMFTNFMIRLHMVPRFSTDVRMALFDSLIGKDIAFFDKNPTGLLISRLSQDVTLMQSILEKWFMACQDFGQAVGGILMCLILMWPAALAAGACIFVAMIAYTAGEHWVSELWKEFNQASGIATTKAEEIVNCFRTIKSFDQEDREATEYQRDIEAVDQIFDKTSVAQGVKDGVITATINFMSAILIYITGFYVFRRPWMGYQSDVVWTVLLAMIFSAVGLGQILTMGDDFQKSRVSAAKILEILNEKPRLADREAGVKPPVLGRIEFRDVGFRYAGCADWAVRGLSFVVEPGETVAVVGESGSGKSTTLQLLLRFYEIEEGEILIDGVDVRRLSVNHLRRNIAMVPQTPVLFSMSISDNIRFGRSKATSEDVTGAAQIGNAHNFITELPDGYETKVQQSSLSGGQKQRICISRAILAGAPVLLLDEATAALDTQSEQLVQQALENYRKGKSALVVAHRLATVINADRILVMRNGRVEETGTHKGLLEEGGYYADLVKYQLQ